MSHSEEETIEVLYNDCYGGWGVSKKAIKLYNDRMKKINPEHKNIKDCIDIWNKRHDPVLVEIFHELGSNFNGGKYNNSKIKVIPKKYENCYIISEYDGLEKVSIDLTKYKLDMITQIIKSNSMNSDEKINELKKYIE